MRLFPHLSEKKGGKDFTNTQTKIPKRERGWMCEHLTVVSSCRQGSLCECLQSALISDLHFLSTAELSRTVFLHMNIQILKTCCLIPKFQGLNVFRQVPPKLSRTHRNPGREPPSGTSLVLLIILRLMYSKISFRGEKCSHFVSKAGFVMVFACKHTLIWEKHSQSSRD